MLCLYAFPAIHDDIVPYLYTPSSVAAASACAEEDYDITAYVNPILPIHLIDMREQLLCSPKRQLRRSYSYNLFSSSTHSGKVSATIDMKNIRDQR